MTLLEQAGPFSLLQELERRGRGHRAQLPTQEEIREEWVGIGFRLGGERFVVSLNEITEILTYPQLSRIPRTKPWVRGIANVRGTLLPVMDLSGYLGKRLATLTRLSRVIVINQQGLSAGLLIDEVLGMRHFFQEESVEVPDDLEETLKFYVSSAFHRDDGVWHVFSMKTLAAHPQFMKVAS
jgi:twitching motility protein PilI